MEKVIPDTSTLVVYGFPAILLIGMVIAGLKKYMPAVSKDVLMLVTGALGALAYWFVRNQAAIELETGLEKWLPDILAMLLMIGAAVGLTPGETATRVKNFVLRK